MFETVRKRLALIPVEGSNTKQRPMRSRLAGSLGVMSMDKKSRKEGCDLRAWIFFSNCTSQLGAKWTFLRRTQVPDLLAEMMAFSDELNPSAEP